MSTSPFMIPALIMALGVCDVPAVAKPRPQQVLVITKADLPGSFIGASPEGFDLSPDGSQIAVAFHTAANHGQNTVWVAVWDISTKRLLSKREVEAPMAALELSPPGSEFDLRYTPAGDTLVVQTAPHLLLLHSGDLSQVLSVSCMQLPTVSKYGSFIRHFDISGDGRWLAVLTGVGLDARPMMAGVQLIDLRTRKETAAWKVRDAPGAIAVSEDGSQVLLSRFVELGNRAWDVLLVESMTGTTLKGFPSGCPYMDACGASDARFWGKGRIATVPKPATGSDGEPLATALRVFDLGSERLIRQLHRRQFLSTGSITITSHLPVVLTVNAGLHHSKPELVAFNLDSGASRTVISPLPRGQQNKAMVDQYSLRISKDGSLVALFEDNAIKVYRLNPSELPLK